jgi:hypothetical protein
VTKAWSPSRPRKDMIRVSYENFLVLCLELCREMNWAIEIERYRNTDCMTLSKVTYKQLLLSVARAVSPQPATPLAPRLAAREGLSPAGRPRQAAVKSPAREADKCAGKRWRPRTRLITTAATTTAPLFD